MVATLKSANHCQPCFFLCQCPDQVGSPLPIAYIRPSEMQELKHILFLLIVINFYLVIRKRQTMSATQRFMISLIVVFFTFFALYFVALSFRGNFNFAPGSWSFLIFAINANIVLPIILTEIILAGYGYIKKK